MTVNSEIDRVWIVNDPNEIVRCRSPQQKPFLRVRFRTGESVEMSFELAEWIGQEARGARLRHAILTAPRVPIVKGPPKPGAGRPRKKEG